MRLRFVLMAVVLVLHGPVRPATADPVRPATAEDVRADFELVDKIGSRKAYEVFLQTHRSGPHADLARQRLQTMGLPRDGRDGPRFGPNYGDDVIIPRMLQERN
jgi:hypothetical protein